MLWRRCDRKTKFSLFSVVLLTCVVIVLYHIDYEPRNRRLDLQQHAPVALRHAPKRKLKEKPQLHLAGTLTSPVRPHAGSYGNTSATCPSKETWGSFCAAWLSTDDRKKAEKCLAMTQKRFNSGREALSTYLPCPCRMLKKPLRGRVVLASLPGSGNTWVRSMLEKVTGVCTGSLWCDSSLRLRGMCGEGVRSPLLLVVKSHTPRITWGSVSRGEAIACDAVIFIHRDPFAATVSERHRDANDRIKISLNTNTHVDVAGPEAFGTNQKWQTIINKQLWRWKEMITNFIVKAGRRPVLLVRYEDLMANTMGELLRMLEFLGMPYSPMEVTTALNSSKFTQFYRNHSDNFEHYTAKQKAVINADIKKTILELDKAGLAHTISLAQYIRL